MTKPGRHQPDGSQNQRKKGAYRVEETGQFVNPEPGQRPPDMTTVYLIGMVFAVFIAAAIILRNC
jgi:hypothetical protein